MAGTTDKFEIRKPEWQAWGLVMTVFTFAVLITYRAWHVNEFEDDTGVVVCVGMWLGLSFLIYRALKRPPLVTVDAKGVKFHGTFGSASIRWPEVVDIDVDWYQRKSKVVHSLTLKGKHSKLTITDLFAPGLVAELLEHLGARRESKNFIGAKQVQPEAAGVPAPGHYGQDPITRELNWIMLSVFGFALIASGASVAYLESKEVGVPTLLAGVLILVFARRSWSRN